MGLATDLAIAGVVLVGGAVALGKLAGALASKAGKEACFTNASLGVNVGVNCGQSDCVAAGGIWDGSKCNPSHATVTTVGPTGNIINSPAASSWVCCREPDPDCNQLGYAIWFDGQSYWYAPNAPDSIDAAVGPYDSCKAAYFVGISIQNGLLAPGQLTPTTRCPVGAVCG